jgi:hypothetical protein
MIDRYKESSTLVFRRCHMDSRSEPTSSIPTKVGERGKSGRERCR